MGSLQIHTGYLTFSLKINLKNAKYLAKVQLGSVDNLFGEI